MDINHSEQTAPSQATGSGDDGSIPYAALFMSVGPPSTSDADILKMGDIRRQALIDASILWHEYKTAMHPDTATQFVGAHGHQPFESTQAICDEIAFLDYEHETSVPMEPTLQGAQAKLVDGCINDLDLLNSILTTAPGHQMILSREIKLCDDELSYKQIQAPSVGSSSRGYGNTDLEADTSAYEARSQDLKALKSRVDSSLNTVNLQSLPVDDWKRESFLNVTTNLSRLQDRFETVAKFLEGDRSDQVMNELGNGELFLSQGTKAVTAKAYELGVDPLDLATELSKITKRKNAARKTQTGTSKFGRSAVGKSGSKSKG